MDTFLVRESNDAEYVLLCEGPELVSLDCDVLNSLHYQVTLPTECFADRYAFSFKFEKKEYVFHLYETPDELREKTTISLVFDDGSKETIDSYVGKKIGDFEWISSDLIYYANKWSYDSERKQSVDQNDRVSKNLILYARKRTILKFTEYDERMFIVGLGYTPKSGIVVIPKLYGGYSEFEMQSVFSSETPGVNTVYIPRNVTRMSYDNFTYMNAVKDVYYEGGSDDFKKMIANYELFTPNATIHYGQYWRF